MNSNKHNIENELKKKVASLVGFSSEKDLHEFKVAALTLDLMHLVRKLMQREKIDQSELAKRLNISKGYLSQLFSADKYLNLDIYFWL